MLHSATRPLLNDWLCRTASKLNASLDLILYIKGRIFSLKSQGVLEAELKKIERCQLLILDDLFLVPIDTKERPKLLEIIECRYERKSIIIISQYPSSNWYNMVINPTIADAILDQLSSQFIP